MALGRGRHRRRPVADPPGVERHEHQQEPTVGPWDEADDPADGQERVDLGALRIPSPPGFDLRVEVSPEGQVVTATLASPRGEMQLGVYAAPRSAGIWDELRGEIVAGVKTQGGSLNERSGPFGIELAGTVPLPNGPAAARFLGVDGPRWFLRALLLGPVATDGTAAAPLEQALRDVVVVRGSDPMPVREPLPLRLPKDVAEQLAAQGDPSFLAEHEAQ